MLWLHLNKAAFTEPGLVQLPIIHHHLEPLSKVVCLVMFSCMFPVGFMFLINFFVYITLTRSFLFNSKLEAQVVCFCMNIQAEKIVTPSCLTGGSFVSSSIWWNVIYINRPRNCTDIQTFVCSVMFCSSLNIWAFNKWGRWTEDNRVEWVGKWSVGKMRKTKIWAPQAAEHP